MMDAGYSRMSSLLTSSAGWFSELKRETKMATESTALAPRAAFQQNLRAIVASSAALLPKHMTADRMVKLVYAAATKTPKLFDCTPSSIGMCLTTCSEIGLEPGDIRGHVYLIPRGNECTLLVGYKGYAELARRSGDIVAIDACVVYDGELFSVSRGLHPNIEHVVGLGVDRSDEKLIAAYAIAVLKSGATVFEVLTRSEIEKHRSRSQSRNNGPWVTDFARMARKSALRSLFTGGLVPMSAEIVRALEIDHDDDTQETVTARTQVRGNAMDSLRTLAQNAVSRTKHADDERTGEEDAGDSGDPLATFDTELAKCRTQDGAMALQARWLDTADESIVGEIRKRTTARLTALACNNSPPCQ